MSRAYPQSGTHFLCSLSFREHHMPEARFPRSTPSPQRKVTDWSLEATMVDRDLTVTQVYNCEQPEREVSLDKRFLNNQRQLQTHVA